MMSKATPLSIGLLTALAALLVFSGCGSEKKPAPKASAGEPVQPAGAGGAAAPAKDAGASAAKADGSAKAPEKKEETVVDKAEAQAKEPLTSPKAVKAAVATADTLTKWVEDHPDHADAPKARLLAARFRVLASGAAAGLLTEPVSKALGGDGAPSRQLRMALKEIEIVEKSGETVEGMDVKALGIAVRAMLAAEATEKDVQMDRAAAMELALGESAEGHALRAAWLLRMERALTALRTRSPESRFRAFSQPGGRILCPSCADAHHVTPDMVSRFLLNPKNTGGIICDAALTRGKDDKTPQGQLKAMQACGPEIGVADKVEPTMLWGANFLSVALLHQASRLAEGPTSESVLQRAVEKRAEAVKALLGAPLMLPQSLVTQVLPDSGEREDKSVVAAVDGLGFGGLEVEEDSLDTFVVGAQSVQAGLRPVAKLEGGKVVSVTLKAGHPMGGEVIDLTALQEAKPAADTGAIEEVVMAAAKLKEAAKAIAADVTPKPFAGDEAGPGASVVVDALAPSWAVERTLDSLLAAGYGHFRFMKTSSHGAALPLVVRSLPERLAEKAPAVYERSLTAVVTKDHVDVWAPKKLVAEKAPEKDDKAKEPEGAEPGYRARKLVRLRIPIPEGMGRGLDSTTIKLVADSLEYFVKRDGAGPRLHVIAGEDALAADVLRVAGAYQELRGKALAEPQAIWPGTSCSDKLVANKKGPHRCPTGVAVAFSKNEPPSSRGITSKLGKKDPPKKKDPPPPKADKAFCNPRDIKVGMRKRTGAFKFCYERELRLKPGLSGRVVLMFNIGANGKVAGSPRVVGGNLKDKAVHQCLIKNVMKASFKPPEQGQCAVRWPFKFQEK